MNRDKTLLKELFSKSGSVNSTVDEDWVLQNIDKITDHAKYLHNTFPLSSAAAAQDQETSLYKRKHEQQQQQEKDEVYILKEKANHRSCAYYLLI